MVRRRNEEMSYNTTRRIVKIDFTRGHRKEDQEYYTFKNNKESTI